MRLHRTPSLHDRKWRNEENENWSEIEGGFRSFSNISGELKSFIDNFNGENLLEKSYNLFNKDAVVKGRLNGSNGELIVISEENWVTSEFIPVEPGKRLQIKPAMGITVMYDSDYNYVGEISPASHPMILPNNVRYIRNTMGASSTEDKYIYLGDNDLPYIEYGYSYSDKLVSIIQEMINSQDDVPEYVNLFDKNKVVSGQLSNGEVIPTEGGFHVSDFIRVSPGKRLNLLPNFGITAMYDGSFRYIRDITNSENPIILPNDVRYIRNTMGQSSIDGKYIYLGEDFMGYFPYGEGPGDTGKDGVLEYVNLFNKNNVVEGELSAETGALLGGPYLVTEYIEVAPNKEIQLRPREGTLAIYDSDKNFIKSYSSGEGPKIVPPDGRYIRNQMSDFSLDEKYIYMGTEDMPYYPYGEGPGATGKDNSKPMKILIIGNSFSVDTFTHLHDICKSAGVNAVVGVAHDSGGSLSDAMTKIRNNQTIHSYYKWTNQTGYVRVASPVIDYAIADESWDIVLFQQMSFASLDYSTFQPHLNDLKAHVKANVSNPNVRFGINAIWSRATTSSSVGDEATQIEQFNTIVENYRTAMIDSDLEILIPTGTAIQNGRGNEFLSQVGTELTRDGSHLDEPVGRYIAAMTVFCTLFGESAFGDVSFKTDDTNGYLIYLAKMVAKKAVDNPYKISEL